MSQPMFTIRSNGNNGNSNGDDEVKPPKAVANLLPCRIHHDGPVDPVEPFWKPSKGDDGKQTAYFRGRRLYGKEVRLPEGYRGVVVEKAEQGQGQPGTTGSRPDGLDEEGAEEEAEPERPKVGEMKVQAEFDEVVAWGHESLADASSDPHVRGMEEWLGVAGKIHSYQGK